MRPCIRASLRPYVLDLKNFVVQFFEVKILRNKLYEGKTNRWIVGQIP